MDYQKISCYYSFEGRALSRVKPVGPVTLVIVWVDRGIWDSPGLETLDEERTSGVGLDIFNTVFES